MSNFGTTIPDPAGGEFGKKEYCNQSVLMEIEIKTTKGEAKPPLVATGETTISISLLAAKGCNPDPAPTQAILQVTQSKISDKGESKNSESQYKPKNEDLCDAFAHLARWGYVKPDEMQELGRDAINETNNLPGFSMSDFMSEVCKTPGGGDGEYKLTLFCVKNIGKCNNKSGSSVSQSFGVATGSAMECNGIIEIEIKMPVLVPNVSFDDIDGQKATIDPCALSALLDCWEKAPEAPADIGFTDAVAIGRLLLKDSSNQENISLAAQKVIDLLKSKCDRAVNR